MECHSCRIRSACHLCGTAAPAGRSKESARNGRRQRDRRRVRNPKHGAAVDRRQRGEIRRASDRRREHARNRGEHPAPQLRQECGGVHRFGRYARRAHYATKARGPHMLRRRIRVLPLGRLPHYARSGNSGRIHSHNYRQHLAAFRRRSLRQLSGHNREAKKAISSNATPNSPSRGTRPPQTWPATRRKSARYWPAAPC